jgi:hypothetical protein
LCRDFLISGDTNSRFVICSAGEKDMAEKMKNESAISNYPKTITLGILYMLTALVLSG